MAECNISGCDSVETLMSAAAYLMRNRDVLRSETAPEQEVRPWS